MREDHLVLWQLSHGWLTCLNSPTFNPVMFFSMQAFWHLKGRATMTQTESYETTSNPADPLAKSELPKKGSSCSASPVFWFNDEQLLHQVLGVLVETFVEGIVQLFYLLENEELWLGLEGRETRHQLVNDAADRPKVRGPKTLTIRSWNGLYFKTDLTSLWRIPERDYPETQFSALNN